MRLDRIRNNLRDTNKASEEVILIWWQQEEHEAKLLTIILDNAGKEKSTRPLIFTSESCIRAGETGGVTFSAEYHMNTRVE